MSSPQVSVYHEQYWLTNLLLADRFYQHYIDTKYPTTEGDKDGKR